MPAAAYLETGCALFGTAEGLLIRTEGSAGVVQAAFGSAAPKPGTTVDLSDTPFATVARRLLTHCYSENGETRIAAPVLLDGGLYGVLSFRTQGTQAGRSFTDSDKRIVEFLAACAGAEVALERAVSLERGRSRVLEMMAGNLPTEEILNEIARFVESQHPGARCVLEETPVSLGAIALAGQVRWRRDVLETAGTLAGIAIEQRQLTERLAYQASHDLLTGLPNRFRLLELLDGQLLRRPPQEATLAVLFIDLDRFKQINDSLGHGTGDRVLIEVAQRLKAGLQGPQDAAARMGGDEFCVILAEPGGGESYLGVAREILSLLRAPYLIGGRELFVTASIGVSLYPRYGLDSAALLRSADTAMYRAKQEGSNALECFEPGPPEGALERLDLENALRRALEKGEFELLFQPVVSMAGELKGMEALLAWNHTKRGRVPAGEFIPLAEATGLIVPIGAWVLQQACETGARWIAAGLPVGRIAVNVSALQFLRPNFIETVRGALGATGFPARLLELELTESLVLRDIGESIHRMTLLRELGVSMAIDDFGTGYSSLNYLRRLPVNELKIDQSFMRDLRESSGTLSVVRTIVELAHSMKLSVTAEGVETLEELELLRGTGCDKVQGHLYGGSLGRREMEEALARGGLWVPVTSVKQSEFHGERTGRLREADGQQGAGDAEQEGGEAGRASDGNGIENA